MNEKQMIKVMEENAKIVAKLLVVLKSRSLINDDDIKFIFDELSIDSLEIE